MSVDEVILTFTAKVAPGWHLYSQQIDEGGPMPTRFSFVEASEYELLGLLEEMGDGVSVRDETYEMAILWYSGSVKFVQRIRCSTARSTIKARVEYMTCDTRVCLPGHYTFIIDVPARVSNK